MGRAEDTAQGTPGRGHWAEDTMWGRLHRGNQAGELGLLAGTVVFQHKVVPQSCWYPPEQVGSRGAGVPLVLPVLPALLQAQH